MNPVDRFPSSSYPFVRVPRMPTNHPIAQSRDIAAAVIAIAKLGGYTYYRSAAPPGAKTIWLGLRKLEGILDGYRLAMARIKDLNH